ncbi:hypothetical protein CEXT_284541 [Caerostris extrusa]|uniref:Uncharacterized protein n=1 Tax=Caerostris extrusa TaxID=172846 RepID=A0AAV4NQN0_CAEEX|nr:hypothetical protein CEXT_284541 [Caerostris extrusa]
MVHSGVGQMGATSWFNYRCAVMFRSVIRIGSMEQARMRKLGPGVPLKSENISMIEELARKKEEPIEVWVSCYFYSVRFFWKLGFCGAVGAKSDWNVEKQVVKIGHFS